ncbi:hypothetical protein TNCT_717301 [Trichonephila clavata]|uniref:Uncharacterized protein n=1 Tax=Trichonephila clavata TaxID=2740835 RepID=A0A8X6LUA5_TRICU|nr:hypothetical protein TNCT_717301 [Trichonephila clavata]
MIHGRVGSEELGENYHTLPLILAGDFSVNFACEDGQQLLKLPNVTSMIQQSQHRTKAVILVYYTSATETIALPRCCEPPHGQW